MGVNRCVEARGSCDVALKGSSLDVLLTETSSQVHFLPVFVFRLSTATHTPQQNHSVSRKKCTWDDVSVMYCIGG
jgi:hypothetical protein